MASGVVVNNVVKMEWQKKWWLQAKGAKPDLPVFCCAAQVYQNDKGEDVSVFFTPGTAFLFGDEDGLFSVEELFESLKEEFSPMFPGNYDEYIPIISLHADEKVCSAEVLEEYGLSEHKEDIEKRCDDIAPYGYEVDAEF